MKQNKTTFIVDYYIKVKGKQFDEVASMLYSAGVLFIAEPWPENWYRIYVRKDVAHVLKVIEEGMKKN